MAKTPVVSSEFPAVTFPAQSSESALLASLRAGRRFLRRNVLALIGVIVVGLWIGISFTAPVISPYPPLKQNMRERLEPPSTQHPMGTDELGRDILSRVFHGGRVSLPIGVLIVTISTVIGTALGSVAGYLGGLWDNALMRFTDLMMSFPAIILAMLIAAALGPGLSHAAIALIVVGWPSYARVVRGLVLSVKEHEYVTAARAVGVGEARIIAKTVLPNCLGPVVVMATLKLGTAILTFAGLSFLGLGALPPDPEWGAMVADGINAFDQWWISAFPGLAIFSLVLAFNFVGDGLRDALDPRLRRSL